MKKADEYRKKFNTEASKNDGEYKVDDQDYDLVNEMFSKVDAKEKAKPEDNAVNFDERLRRYELDEEVVHTFTDNAKEDRNLKKTYAFWLLVFFVLQLIAFNTVFIFKGLDKLSYDANTFNIYVMSGVVEIISLITIIVKYLFKDNITEALNNVLEKNKKDK